jgi:hypothetical protein
MMKYVKIPLRFAKKLKAMMEFDAQFYGDYGMEYTAHEYVERGANAGEYENQLEKIIKGKHEKETICCSTR